MSGIKILCDTDILIRLLNNDETVVDFLSEKAGFYLGNYRIGTLWKTKFDPKRKKIIDLLVENCFIIDLIQPVKQIVKNLKQIYKLKLPNTIIAASAICLDIPFITADADFSTTYRN